MLYGTVLSNTVIPCTAPKPAPPGQEVIVFDDSYTLAKFKVARALKQPDGSTIEAGDVINVRSSTQGSLCGYQLLDDAKYIIYPYESDPRPCEAEGGAASGENFSVSLCRPGEVNPSDAMVEAITKECGADVPPPKDACKTRCARLCEYHQKLCSWCERICDART